MQRAPQPLQLLSAPETPGPLEIETLFRDHHTRIHRALRALGVDPTAVDDAAQEVFLGEIRRAVFVLCEVEEMTAPEAAAILDIKLNTVYSHLRKARLGLESFMTGDRDATEP